MTDIFSVKSGVKQGCILSPFLFIIAIDWLITEITKDGNRGIRWALTSILEELDYADDIGLLSSRYKDMQEKIGKLTTTAPQIRVKLNAAKNKLTTRQITPLPQTTVVLWKRFRTLHIWEAKSQQMETLQKMPLLGSERQVRPSLC